MALPERTETLRNRADRLRGNWSFLRQAARKHAIIDYKKDYVVIPWVNKDINGQLENTAAEIIADKFTPFNPTQVLAIGRSGLSLGKKVTDQFRRRQYEIGYTEALKISADPESQKDHQIVETVSYTQGPCKFVIPVFQPHDRVLIIDDVCARGTVAEAIGRAVQSQNEVDLVGFGIYFDKKFQGGLQKLVDTLTVPAFSVIRIESIKNGLILEDGRTAYNLLTPQKAAL